ncbi:methyltransferase-like protein 22 [Momordica charantia]|uniref:Methyltransferase-like protein 22 n=1 Tax=Momordica charantia TaxID=3673 RepID=A0A6J1DL23_MOMCH|nr:methyltransferase-like protein 22 [Momordica charantia]
MSTIPIVGLQVWKAELALSDFVLHKITLSELDGTVALELVAGTGSYLIALARTGGNIACTDKGDHVLENCAKNIGLNSGGFSAGVAVQYVFLALSEVEEAQGVSLLVAADVIYSDDLTDAFFNILEKFVSRFRKDF